MIPTKKLQNGFEIPIYGLGTWLFTESRREPNPNYDAGKGVEIIRRTLDSGVSLIDTAEIYGGGQVEEVIGEAISGLDRSRIFLTSKVMGSNTGYDEVLTACRRSLERLQTGYLDLYLIHWPNPEVPIEETMRAMNELADDGLIKNIGVSNFSKESLAQAQKHSPRPIVVNQVHYNLSCRESQQSGLLAYCQANDVLLQAWRPIELGRLTTLDEEIMEEMCQKYQKTPAQIAINWLVSQANVTTLSKTRSQEHLEENLTALNWQMGPEDVERLKQEYPGQQATSEIVPLG